MEGGYFYDFFIFKHIFYVEGEKSFKKIASQDVCQTTVFNNQSF